MDVLRLTLHEIVEAIGISEEWVVSILNEEAIRN